MARILLLCLLLLSSLAWADDVEVRFWRMADATVKLAVVDPSLVTVGVALAEGTDPRRGVWRDESSSHMIERLRPLVAVTGTYFDLATHRPVCTLVSEGRLLCHGICHGYLTATADGRVEFGYQRDYDCGCHVNFATGLPMAVAAGPILMMDGVPHDNFHDEGFTWCGGVFGVKRRTLCGVTRAGKLVLGVTSPVTVERARRIATECGLKDAMLLDGGSSSMLYVDGDFLAVPGRRLTNWIVVMSRRP